MATGKPNDNVAWSCLFGVLGVYLSACVCLLCRVECDGGSGGNEW